MCAQATQQQAREIMTHVDFSLSLSFSSSLTLARSSCETSSSTWDWTTSEQACEWMNEWTSELTFRLAESKKCASTHTHSLTHTTCLLACSFDNHFTANSSSASTTLTADSAALCSFRFLLFANSTRKLFLSLSYHHHHHHHSPFCPRSH